MLRRDIADRLYSLVYKRFREEQPKRELSYDEIDSIWYEIYGKLCRGETETDVEKWCNTVELNERKIHVSNRNGY